MTATTRVDLTDIDIFVRGEHTEIFRRLRREEPIYWNEGADGNRFWALTTYEDVLWAYREHSLFSSERGAILGGSFRNEADTASGQMLVAMDLPRHRLLKQQIHPALATAVAANVNTQVRELVYRALDRAVADGGCDFAMDVALELPAGALMVVMGIGYEEAHELIRLTRRMVGYRDEHFVDTGDDERLRLADLQADIFDFFAEILVTREPSSGDDLINVLLGSRINGRRLSEEEILYNCMNVAIGGNETSSYTAATGLHTLMEHGDQYDVLLSEPGVVGTAVEEILRWSSTNAYVQRVAKADVRRGDVLIRAGDSVTLWNVSANRDESQFPDADRFDVRRTGNRHLSYGAGIHRCIGAGLAAVELSLLFERIAAQGIRFRPAGPPQRLRSNFILGVTSLPVEVTGR